MSRRITLNVSQVPQSISSNSIFHYDALMELGDYSHKGTTNDTFFNNAIAFSAKKFLVCVGHCTEDEDYVTAILTISSRPECVYAAVPTSL